MYLENTYRLSKSVAETAQRLLQEDLTYLKLRKLYYDDSYQFKALNTEIDEPVIVKEFESEYS